MHSFALLAGLAIIIPVFSEELRALDVPAACSTICGPIVTLTNTCDVDPNEGGVEDDKRRALRFREVEEADEAIEANCICTNKSFDVASVMALCASCLAQNGAETDDAEKIMSQCSFTSSLYTASAATQVAGIQVQATKPAFPTSSTSGDPSGSSRVSVTGFAIVGTALVALMLG